MPLIDPHTVAVPWAECITLQPGTISSETLAILRQRGFDDAPVWDGTEVLGIVSADTLEKL